MERTRELQEYGRKNIIQSTQCILHAVYAACTASSEIREIILRNRYHSITTRSYLFTI